ncbi:MAG: hypothetical protein IKA76_03565 [Clostridia bacterium]|nr:hypothetical protein [Clostridia bacterium]
MSVQALSEIKREEVLAATEAGKIIVILRGLTPDQLMNTVAAMERVVFAW